MKKIITNNWFPEEFIQRFNNDFVIDHPDKERNRYSPEELKARIKEYHGVLLYGDAAQKDFIDAGSLRQNGLHCR